MASANDLWQAPGRIHGAWVWGGDFARAIGGLTMPGLTYTFLDDYWETVGAELGAWVTRLDVITEHLHVAPGKAAHDESYATAYVGHQESREVFLRWRRTDWPALRARLAMLGFDQLGAARRPPGDRAITQLFHLAGARFLETWTEEAVRILLILLERAPDHAGANAAMAAAMAHGGAADLAQGYLACARRADPHDPDLCAIWS